MATGVEFQDFYETALKVSREAGQVKYIVLLLSVIIIVSYINIPIMHT